MKFYLLIILFAGSISVAAGREKPVRNPVIWADVPDPSVIRVGDTYYMSSTTMHMSPGIPIMKSSDLVNWEMVSYAYDILEDSDALNLQNGRNAYGRGSWASSLRHHNGKFYVSSFSWTTGKTYVFTTYDIEKGPWKKHSFAPVLHDNSLFFDSDGRVYMAHGSGDIRLTELNPDFSGIREGGIDKIIIPNASLVASPDVILKAEGTHLHKINGWYYIMTITWPRGGMRTALVHRARHITGPYEGRIALQDKGVAQGGLIDTPSGEWFAMLFNDRGAVGRTPFLVPVKWENDWPVLGVNGIAPEILYGKHFQECIPACVASDEFERALGDPMLPLVWQWNHNPDNTLWSVSERPGYLRLRTGRVDADLENARNTLTQRTFGPLSRAYTSVDAGRMRDGDVAGLTVFQKVYGAVGVLKEGQTKSVVMISAESGTPQVIESVMLNQKVVYLKIECDFRNLTDTATFYYSLDGKNWNSIGKPVKMVYTLPAHFMGYRFGLFNFATKQPGGSADFDFFRISNRTTNKQPQP